MSLEPSLSASVTVAVITWSSVNVPLISTPPMSLIFATTMLKDCVATPPSPSVAVNVTDVVPTLASLGVPVNVPEPSPASARDNQAPVPVHPAVQARVIVFEFGEPSSASVDVNE